MANDDSIKSTTASTAAQYLQQTSTQTKATETNTSGTTSALGAGEAMGKQEFLTLLVNQLQNQDPLDPMDSDEFSVQLAQFSQVEQLIGINEKLDSQIAGETGVSSVSSMASFLGHEVTLRSENVVIDNGKGPSVSLVIPEGTQSARIDLIDENGGTVGSKEVSEMTSGRQTVELNPINVPNGVYSLRAVLVDENGQFKETSVGRGGLVEGFILEPEPALLINGEHVSLDEVVEVALAGTKQK